LAEGLRWFLNRVNTLQANANQNNLQTANSTNQITNPNLKKNLNLKNTNNSTNQPPNQNLINNITNHINNAPVKSSNLKTPKSLLKSHQQNMLNKSIQNSWSKKKQEHVAKKSQQNTERENVEEIMRVIEMNEVASPLSRNYDKTPEISPLKNIELELTETTKKKLRDNVSYDVEDDIRVELFADSVKTEDNVETPVAKKGKSKKGNNLNVPNKEKLISTPLTIGRRIKTNPALEGGSVIKVASLTPSKKQRETMETDLILTPVRRSLRQLSKTQGQQAQNSFSEDFSDEGFQEEEGENNHKRKRGNKGQDQKRKKMILVDELRDVPPAIDFVFIKNNALPEDNQKSHHHNELHPWIDDSEIDYEELINQSTKQKRTHLTQNNKKSE